MLFIVECKTAGQEFDKAYKDTLSDGGQLFSYWQQEQSTKWLVLYTSDYKDGVITYKAPTVNCSDDPNIVALAKKDMFRPIIQNGFSLHIRDVSVKEQSKI